ncbi:MAG: YpdA family putative bacillithiol disulfide reductase [bacterium]|nr:YpdA family putative bacillithiol disulfide reductase [bacterium]
MLDTRREWPLLIVGSGPAGIGVALEAKRRGVAALLVERGALCHTLYRFPERMTYFSTAELLEFAGIPLVCAGAKPTKREVLDYFTRIVTSFRLPFETDCAVTGLRRESDQWIVSSSRGEWRCRAVVLATGSYDQPNLLYVPGEHLPHVSHYFESAHPFIGKQVIIVGGKNSAAEAALELYRAGAHVTLIHRGAGVSPSVKYWIKPDLENRIRDGEIRALYHAQIAAIEAGIVKVRIGERDQDLSADAVLLLTGYQPDYEWLRRMGFEFEGEADLPVHDPLTLESNLPGVYFAGVLLAGRQASRVFIENSREHGARILKHFLRET